MNTKLPQIVLVCAALMSSAWAADQQGASKLAFEKLRSLVGEWDGTYKWTGARTDSGSMKVSYHLTGRDSALIEDLSTEGPSVMTSVYHLDGADLRLTHYCGAQNQPRLKADKIDLGKGLIQFAFVDATNLSSPDAPHVTGLEVDMSRGDQLMLTFLFEGKGKQSWEHITLTRVKNAAK